MKNYTMNDICEIVTDYVSNGSFASLRENVEYLNNPDYARLIRLVDFHNNFSENSAIYISKKSYNFLSKSKLFGGEIIISNVGNIGESFLVPYLKVPMSLAPNCIMIKTNQIDRYIYYYLCSDIGKLKLQSLTSGSAIQKFNKTDFKKLKIYIHEIADQQHIVNILGSIDDKIENNELLNKKFERYLQNIYLKYLSKTYIIKNNYNTINLRDIATFNGGYSYKGGELVNSNCGLLTIKNFDRNIGFKLDGFKDLVTDNRANDNQYVDLLDIVVAHTDLTQNAEIIGNAEIVLNKAKYKKIVASMDLVIVRPKSNISNSILYLLLHNPDFKKHALGYCTGTTVLHLNKRALNEYLVYLPKDQNTQHRIEKIVNKIITKQKNLIDQNIKLSRLKELYLKKFFG